MNIFVAGASGAIGIPLLRELLRQGHTVCGLTNSTPGAQKIQEVGATPVQADIFDFEALRSALRTSGATVIIDELTSLPANPADLAKALPRDRKVRLEGGGNLFRAAKEVGVRRYIQQSTGFYLSAGEDQLADESSAMALDASPGVMASTTMYAELEQRVQSSAMEGLALRYGFFYGPGTWYWHHGAAAEQVRSQQQPIIDRGQGVWSFVHVEDAAKATVQALTADPGVYNIVDNDPSAVSVWLPAFAKWVGAPAPPQLSLQQAMASLGEDAIYTGTKLHGASNAKARQTLGFAPRILEWLQTA